MMTPQKKRFVQYYLSDPHSNGTQSAIKAGYSEKSAYSQASRLLKDVKVIAEIDREREKRAKKFEITADRVIQELARIGFANMQDFMNFTSESDPFVDFSTLTRDQAAAISEVTIEDYVEGRGNNARDVKRIKFKLHDKRAALVDLGKHLGLFKEDPPEGDLASIIARLNPSGAKKYLLKNFSVGAEN